MIALAPSKSRSRWRSTNAGWPERTRRPSQTPSPSTKPASKTETTARSRGTSAPLTHTRIPSLRGSSAKSCVPWATALQLGEGDDRQRDPQQEPGDDEDRGHQRAQRDELAGLGRAGDPPPARLGVDDADDADEREARADQRERPRRALGDRGNDLA